MSFAGIIAGQNNKGRIFSAKAHIALNHAGLTALRKCGTACSYTILADLPAATLPWKDN